MSRVALIIAGALALSIGPVRAAESINAYIPDAQSVGQVRMRIALWDLYDATLYAPGGRYRQGAPFALSLTYLRDIRGDDIADRSVTEMRRQGPVDELRLAKWHEQMRRIFPDVRPGVTLTGVSLGNGKVVFLEGGRIIGRIEDAEFARRFFDIWLGARTSAPQLRAELLGGQGS